MTYRDLDVYKRAYALAVQVHEISLRLPKELRFDLADQIRRASRSIPSNIAEGYGRGKSKRDTISQLKTALGSNDEILFNLEFMKDANLLPKEAFHQLSRDYIIVGKELFQLIKSLNQAY